MKEKFSLIQDKLKSKFFFNHDMSKKVWLNAGGKASVFCLVDNAKDLEIILNIIPDYESYEVMGAGSNFLIRDEGFKGLIIKLGKNFNQLILGDTSIEVGCGVLDINLSKFAQINKIKNFEFYSGIPGSVGGAVKMNAGCYGCETKDILKDIQTIDSEGKIKKYDKKKIKLTYRNSSIPKGEIITKVNYNISYGSVDEINYKIDEIKSHRYNSQPIRVRTGGSTFKNPKNHSAAKLIEDSGCKGLSVGDVHVSHKHSNFLINTNKASASDIEKLGNIIIEKVFNKFQIMLEWEIKIIGN